MGRLIIFLFLTVSCTFNKFTNITESDRLMYVDYVEYLKILSNGSASISNSFGTKSNSTFFYKDFKEYGVSFLAILDKVTNQQYIVFYGYDTANTISKIQDAKSVKNFGLNASFNLEALNTFAQIMPFLQSKIQKNIKKIIIGSDGGGIMAYLLALELTTNLKTPISQVEVITFNPILFTYNFTPDFNSTSIFIREDKYSQVI